MDGFRFSHDKLFGIFRLEQFKRTAKELESIINATRSHVDSFVLTCEDKNTYDWSKVSFAMDEVNKALEQRKRYSLGEVDEEVWNRALQLENFMKIPNDKEVFMVCLTHDKAEENRLLFYGQGLDERTYENVMNRFHKRGWLYTLGNGHGKPSRLMRGIIDSGLHLKNLKP
ncbi:MAG TPA: hypothetical protein ENI22_01090 [Candidatus Pacearchaeota archaeon]|nr:hypothetical protein [Candidatus Pacearchaeota archaeon]